MSHYLNDLVPAAFHETVVSRLSETIEAYKKSAEELHALADEASEWGRQSVSHTLYPPAEREAMMKRQFLRLAQKLDAIANRLAEKQE